MIGGHLSSWAEGLFEVEVACRYPGVVFCSVTPYGVAAPPELRNAESLNVFQSSGWGFHTLSHADPVKPPLKGPGRFSADYEAGLDAALCMASSLFPHLHTGAGEFIDVSAHAVLASRADCVLGRFVTGEISPQNSRDDYDQQGPASVFRVCGRVRLPVHDHWHALVWRENADEPTIRR